MKHVLTLISLSILTFTSTVALADDTATTPATQTTAQTSTATPAATDDATINQNVQNKLAAEPSLTGTPVTVNTNQGVVTVSGSVATSDQAGKVIEIAESVPGVKNVDTSSLTAKDGQSNFADTVTTAKVKGVFIREKLFGDTDVPIATIVVTTKNGVVFLTGTADNQAQIKKAIVLAKKVKDVKKVRAKVAVKKNGATE
jgi:hyperosmotically inducible protein